MRTRECSAWPNYYVPFPKKIERYFPPSSNVKKTFFRFGELVLTYMDVRRFPTNTKRLHCNNFSGINEYLLSVNLNSFKPLNGHTMDKSIKRN